MSKKRNLLHVDEYVKKYKEKVGPDANLSSPGIIVDYALEQALGKDYRKRYNNILSMVAITPMHVSFWLPWNQVRLLGIQISIKDYWMRQESGKIRRVMVRKDRTLDLDALKEKVEEIFAEYEKAKATIQKQREYRDVKDGFRDNVAVFLKKNYPDVSVYVTGSTTKHVNLQLSTLTAEEARLAVEAIYHHRANREKSHAD